MKIIFVLLIVLVSLSKEYCVDLNHLKAFLEFKDVYETKDSSNNIYADNDPFSALIKVVTPDTVTTNVPDSTKSRVDKYRTLIIEKATKYGIDPNLLYALVAKESNGDPRAVSRAGAMGLAQLMPATAKELGVLNPFDPEQNLEGAAKHIRKLQDMYNGNKSLTLAAYNSGIGNVKKAGYTVPKIKETQDYVTTILSWLPKGV